jgi:peptidyl-prolyl cis-trans isomerase B (cyclophilin B)
MIIIHTNFGKISLELTPEKTPKTVANFLKYAEEGFYEGTLFHRVIPGFMIQGGGYTEGLTEKDNYEPIENEAATGLTNRRGTIAMARTSDPHSATSQFFINLADNLFLDYKAANVQGYGYCVFGSVKDGMDVVDKIAQVKTGNQQGHGDVPLNDVIIEKVEIVAPVILTEDQ